MDVKREAEESVGNAGRPFGVREHTSRFKYCEYRIHWVQRRRLLRSPRSSYVDGYYFSMQSASYAAMWVAQPEIRSVVNFISQNFMQVPLDLYNIKPAQSEPNSDHPAMASIRNPREKQGMGALQRPLLAIFSRSTMRIFSRFAFSPSRLQPSSVSPRTPWE